MTDTVIELEHVTKRFGATVAVDDISLAVKAGEFLALLGPSGCGKTTLLRLIAGLEPVDRGRVRIGAADMTGTPPHKRPVNMMFQSYALFPHMTVAENVAFGLRQDRLPADKITARVGESLTMVELAGFEERKPHQLSGGQQQRVALARCIAKRPQAVLLDEPLAALDRRLRERTQRELVALQRRLGIAFIIVTHDQDEAMAMAGRIAVLDAGRMLQIGHPSELYDHPADRRVAAFFGEVNLWDGIVTASGAVSCAVLGVSLPADRGFGAGMPVAVAVRPERVSLISPQSTMLTGDLRVEGTVADVVYRGSVSTYVIQLRSGAMIRSVRQTLGGNLRIGDAVAATWPIAATMVLK